MEQAGQAQPAPTAAPTATQSAPASAPQTATSGPEHGYGGQSFPGNAQAQTGGELGNATPAEIQAQIEKIKIGSVEAELPVHIAKAVKDLERGFQAKAREAAEAKRFQAENAKREALLKQDPLAYLKQFGQLPDETLDQLMERRLEEKLAYMEMSPEQRKLQEYEARIRSFEDEKRQAQEKAAEQFRQQQEQQAFQTFDQEISEAFTDLAKRGLPKDPHLVGMIAFEMQRTHRLAKKGEMERGLTAKEAAAIIEKKWTSQAEKYVRGLDASTLETLLGEEKIKAIRESHLSKLREGGVLTGPKANPGPGANASASQTREQSKIFNQEEWDRFFGRT